MSGFFLCVVTPALGGDIGRSHTHT